MEQTSLVSIIIPVYNAERYLEQNIESVLRQTYDNIEVIYVCDGCTDNSLDILRRLANDRRIRIINRKENLGAAASRNEGAKEAKGEWLIFWDADDVVIDNAIATMIDSATKYSADMVICTLGDASNRNVLPSRFLESLKKQIDNYPVLDGQKCILDISSLIVCNAPFNKLISRTIYESGNVWFQDLKNCNDVYFSVATLLTAKRIAYIDTPLYFYRDDAASSISSTRNTVKTYILDALELVRELMQKLKYDEAVFKNYAFSEIMGYRETRVFVNLMEEYNCCYANKWKISFEKNYLYNVADFDKIRGKKVVIFGAGQVGKDYFKAIEDDCEIVNWVDSCYDGVRIHSVDSLCDMEYDYVIVATKSEVFATQMVQRLLLLGVDLKKIIMSYPQKNLCQ